MGVKEHVQTETKQPIQQPAKKKSFETLNRKNKSEEGWHFVKNTSTETGENKYSKIKILGGSKLEHETSPENSWWE